MSERYSRLYALPERLYTEGAPVLILAGALLKDNQTGRVLAQLKFRSLSAVPIRALKISLRAFDVTGTELHGVAEEQYLDLDVRLGASFGEKTAVFLPDSVTRSFSCACTAAVFADGSTWTAAEDAVWEPLHPQQSLKTALGGLELLDQYRRETSPRAEYVVTEDRGLWLCACGTPNPQTEVTCMSCGTNRERVLAALDVKALKAHADELAAEKARKAEEKAKRAAEAARLAAEEREHRKKQLAKVRKWLAIAAAAAAVLVAAILVTTKVIIPNSKYNTAVKLLEEEKYDEALAAFEELGDYKDAAEMKKEANYQKAVQLLECGSYDEAIAALATLGDYKDASAQATEGQKQKNYHHAEELLSSQNYDAAEDIFVKLGGYKDSSKRVLEVQEARNGQLYSEAAELENQRKLTEAYAAFIELGEYSDSEQRAQDCAKQYAEIEKEAGNIDLAIEWYAKAGETEAANEARYNYAIESKNDPDEKTYKYLKLLAEQGYADSQAIYDLLCDSITYTVIVNKSEDDHLTNADSAKKYGNLYLHIRIDGGYQGQKFAIKVQECNELGNFVFYQTGFQATTGEWFDYQLNYTGSPLDTSYTGMFCKLTNLTLGKDIGTYGVKDK